MTLLELIRRVEHQHYPEGLTTGCLQEIHDRFVANPDQDPLLLILRVATQREVETSHMLQPQLVLHDFDTIRDTPDGMTRDIGVELAIGDQFTPIHSEAIVIIDNIVDDTVTVTRQLGDKEITTDMDYTVAQDLVRSYRWKRI